MKENYNGFPSLKGLIVGTPEYNTTQRLQILWRKKNGLTKLHKVPPGAPPKPSLKGFKRGTQEWTKASNALASWYRNYIPNVKLRHNTCQRNSAHKRSRINGIQPRKILQPIDGAPLKPKLVGKPGSLERNASIAARLRWYRKYVPDWKERVNKRDTEYVRNKRQQDSDFKLHSFLRATLSRALRYTDDKKTKRTLEYVGCSVEKLKVHLESQFVPGMSWKNYGTEWQVDHIIPLASRLPAQITAHYTNLQPLWSKVNNAKDNAIDTKYLYKIIAHPDTPGELLDVALALVSY